MSEVLLRPEDAPLPPSLGGIPTRRPMPPGSDALNPLSNITDSDLERLFGDAHTPGPGGSAPTCPSAANEWSEPFDTGHLVALGRELLTQYLSVFSSFVADAFSRADPSGWATEVDAARQATSALAEATGDAALATCLDDLRPLLHEATDARGRARTRFLTRLEAWVTTFAALLPRTAGESLIRQVQIPARPSAEMRRLAEVPGIGRQRLRRLVLAGLHDLTRLTTSDPAEVALVTGLSVPLAARVVQQAHTFIHNERRRALAELDERARWMLQQPLEVLDGELSDLAMAARTSMITFLEKFNLLEIR